MIVSCSCFIVVLHLVYSSLQVYDSQHLVQDLLRNYTKQSAPQRRNKMAVSVNVTFNLRNILDLEEENEIVTMSGWMEINWFDLRLTWNESYYGNVDTVHLVRDDLWIPDIMIDNAVDEYDTVGKPSDILNVKSNGKVIWFAGNVYRTKCSMDLTYFPFDDQLCHLLFATWSHSREVVEFDTLEATLQNLYKQHGQWFGKSINIEQTMIYGDYPSAVVHLGLKRRSTFFVLNMGLPVMATTFLNAFVFLLPVESGEKITLSTALFLSYAVFLGSIKDNMPKTSTTISIFAMFVAVQLLLSMLSILCTVLLLRCKENCELYKKITRLKDVHFFNIFFSLAVLTSAFLLIMFALKPA